jgi:hypothetical protein
MEIKDLATSVELGSEMSDVRGGYYYQPYGGYSLDLDLTSIGNVSNRQSGSNRSTIRNGNVNADTYWNANKSVGATFNGGQSISYAPINTLTQVNDNNFSNSQSFSGITV